METPQELGKGDNKVFVPYEATAALGSLSTLKELFAQPSVTQGQPAPSASARSAQALSRMSPPPPGQPVRARPAQPSEE